MSESIFRNATPPPVAPTVTTKNDAQATLDSGIEVPYMDYEAEHGKPYLVDHFKLGDHWADAEGGFSQEIHTINDYVEGKIKSGEIQNSSNAVNELLRGMEKLNNLTKEERTVVKMEVLSHYVEFLQKNDITRQNLRRYNGF